MEKMLYKEVQRFRQPWMWALLLTAVFMVLVFQTQQFSSVEPGTEAYFESLKGLIVTVLIMGGVVALFLIVKLEVKISTRAIRYRFWPFMVRWRILDRKEVAHCWVRRYSPLTEYGGWGIRFGRPGKGSAYTVSGNWGLQLVLTNGKKILLGTQQPEAMERAAVEFIQQKGD